MNEKMVLSLSSFSLSKTKKAQLSLEFLMVLAIALAALLFSMTALTHLESLWYSHLSVSAAEMALADIGGAANEVCVLGDGNRRLVSFYSPNLESAPKFSLSADGRTLTASAAGQSVSKSLLCKAELGGDIVSGKEVLVEANSGKVSIRSS